MPGATTTILTPSDRQVLDLFFLIKEKSGTDLQIQILGAPDTIGITPESSQLKLILESDLSLISTATIAVGQANIRYHAHRVNSDPNHPEQVNQHSAIYSSISITYSNHGQFNSNAALEWQPIILKFLRERHLLPAVGEANQSQVEEQLAVLSAVRTSATDQIARTNDFFRGLVTQFEQKQQDLDTHYETRRKDLDRKHQENLADIEMRQTELDKLRQQLDDRDNTHARRALGSEQIKTLQARQKEFQISPATAQLRRPIHVIFVALLLATFSGAVWSLYVWGTTPADSWGPITITSAIKTIVFGFGFLTSAGLYISWMNRWFDKHADAQFLTKQMEIDFNRASWAVEAALEWKSDQGEQMPDVLLAGITKHLFETKPGESADYSPMDALASNLLGAASTLKLKMAGSEVELDRKGINRLQKSEG
jgi:hypothetical protein